MLSNIVTCVTSLRSTQSADVGRLTLGMSFFLARPPYFCASFASCSASISAADFCGAQTSASRCWLTGVSRTAAQQFKHCSRQYAALAMQHAHVQ